MRVLALATSFGFEQPGWLWLVALVPVLVVVSVRSLAGLHPARRWMAVFFRSVLIVLVACCLAGIEHLQRNDDLTVMFLMDRSYSVESRQDFQEDFIREAAVDIPKNDRLGLIDFARSPYLQQMPMSGGYFIPPGRLPQMANTDRTDLASAMRLAMAMFPHDTAKRIVLMSDGNENLGDVKTEAARARADGIPVDVVPLRYNHRNEVYFERLLAPTQAAPGEQVPLRMVLHTEKPVTGTVSIFQNGELVPLHPQDSEVRLSAGSNTLFMKLAVNTSGPQTFEAVFRPDDAAMDVMAVNNRSSAFTFVSGASTVLVVSTNLDHDRELVAALRKENVRVDVKTTDELGTFGLLQMMNYATIILANVPAATFTDRQQEELAIFVKDMGSGLIMLGGDEAFGAGGWIGSPVEEVMPVTFEIKHKRVIPRGALVLIMHSCEIPRGNYWGKEMAKRSVDTISSQDYFGVLAYTYSPGGENWEVPLDLNTNKVAVKAKIDRMQIGDMPDFDQTMRMALKELTEGRGSDAAQKHVIILSDGDASAPTPGLLRDYARTKVTVSTIGIGWGGHVMESTLVNIAEKTGGNYYSARNPRQLPQIFSKESKTVRRPLIIDEPFMPQVLHTQSELIGGMDVGMGSIPELGGMVLTSVKQNPNVMIPMVRVVEDGEDPVLVHWQYELGKAVVFASGYWPKWGGAWTQWSKFGKLWAQIVRWTMRQESPANFDTYTRIDGNRGHIVIDALDKDAGYLDNLQLRTRIIGPNDKPVPLRFVQTGPGKYEAEFDVDRAGQYLANVQVADQGKYLGTIRTGLSVPYSPEYSNSKQNEPLLRELADSTGGRWLDKPAAEAGVFSHDLPPTVSTRPAWEWVLTWLILPVFLLDVAVRRLANWLAFSIAAEILLLVTLLFGLGIKDASWWGILGAILLAELVGWTIRYQYIRPLLDFLTFGVTALSGAGERSHSSLGKLKDTREDVRARHGSAGAGDDARHEAEPPVSSISPPRRRREEQPTGDVADLTASLGGAGAEGSQSDVEKKQDPMGGESEGESPTSRLLRSKRRRKHDGDSGE